MSLDRQPDGRPKKKRERSTKDLARPWLSELASREKPSRTRNVAPLKQKQEGKNSSPDRLNRSPSAAEPPQTPPPDRQFSTGQSGDKGWWIGGFLFGFAVGLALALTYGWVLDPRPLPVTPAELTPQAKEVYIRLIAAAFFYSGSEEQAKTRIEKLGDANFQTTLIDLTERYIDENRDLRDIRAMVKLAGVLGQPSPKMVVFLPTPTVAPTATDSPVPTPTPRPTDTVTPVPTQTPSATATATNTPTSAATPTRAATVTPSRTATATPTLTPSVTATATRTPTPSRTVTPGPDSPYGVARSEVVCDRANSGLLRLNIRDRLGNGVPGVEIRVSWPGGRDTIFTGLKPDIDPGYADFQMGPDEVYQVELVSLKTSGLIPEIRSGNRTLCPTLPALVEPSWQVLFQQGVN